MKTRGVRSGEQASQFTGLPRPIHEPDISSSNKSRTAQLFFFSREDHASPRISVSDMEHIRKKNEFGLIYT